MTSPEFAALLLLTILGISAVVHALDEKAKGAFDRHVDAALGIVDGRVQR